MSEPGKRVRRPAKELRAEKEARAGCVRLAYSRHGKGPLTGVYKNAESVVCEEHHTLVCVATRADAMGVATEPCEFCDDCREAEPDGILAP